MKRFWIDIQSLKTILSHNMSVNIRSGDLSHDSTTIETIKKELITSKSSDITKLNCHFQTLYQILELCYKNGSPNDKFLITLNDTISVCLLRMFQLVKSSQMKFIEISPDQIHLIFIYIFHYLNHTFNPLINSLNSVFNKLINFVKINFDQHESLFHHWIGSLLALDGLSKNLYNILEILVKQIEDINFVLDTYPQFPEACIEAISSDALANCASKTLLAVYCRVYDSSKINEWYENWHPIVLNRLESGKLNSRQNLQVYLLPGLFQICPQSLTFLLEEYKDKTSDNEVDFFISLLKIGQDLSLIDPLNSVSKTTLKKYLVHVNPKFRLNSLSLVLGGNTKSTKSLPISNEIYSIIKNEHIIDVFMNDFEDIEIRNQFTSAMTQFMGTRFKESINSLQKELSKLKSNDFNTKRQHEIETYISNGKQFFTWLVENLVSRMNVGSNYSELSTSMRLLQLITEKIESSEFNIFDNASLVHLLVRNLFSNYENLRELSLDMLLKCRPSDLLVKYLGENDRESKLLNEACSVLHSLTGRKSDGGAKCIDFLFSFHISYESEEAYKLIDFCIEKIRSGIKLFKNDSNKDEKFIHGYFKALFLIICRFDSLLNSKKHYSEKREYFDKIFHEMISAIHEIWDVTKGILSNSLDEELDEEDTSKIKLNYSWKVIKDSNVLLNKLLTVGILNNFVSNDEFLNSCNLIIEQLGSIKHRGAFSSIYPSFISICQLCFESKDICQYPTIWLLNNIDLIESKNQFISRRSGGIPFLISGILIAAKEVSKGGKLSDDLIEQTLPRLISIANKPYVHIADEKVDIPQVHAFNCIKQIFIESQLANESLNYVEIALDLSLSNFTCENWSIRNCAVMLFGSIQQRIFGNKKVSFYPSKLFFNKFSTIDRILFQHLEVSLEHQTSKAITHTDNQILFPILIILSKLNTSSSEEPILNKFKSILLQFLSNRYWKIREMVARCVSSIFTTPEILDFSLDFLGRKTTDVNTIHGSLLTILESVSKFKDSPSERIALKEALLENHDYLNCKSYLVSQVYLKLISELSDGILPTKYLNSIGNFTIGIINSTDSNLDGGRQLCLSASVSLLLNQYLKNDDMTSFLDLSELCLCSNEYFKVQLSVLKLIDRNSLLLKGGEVGRLVWNLIQDEKCWNYVKADGLKVFSKLVSHHRMSMQEIDKAIVLLHSYVTSDTNENIQLMALECLGHLIVNSNLKLEFINKCKEFSEESNSYKFRYSAIRAIILYVLKEEDNDLSVRSLLIIFCNGLNDDEGSIRTMSSECLSQIFAYGFDANPTFVSKEFSDKLSEKFTLSNSVLTETFTDCLEKEAIHRLMESRKDISTGSLLFDVESSNLYKNQIELTEIICQLYQQSHPHISEVIEPIHTSITEINKFICATKGSGITGWATDDFMSLLLIKSIMCAKAVSSIEEDSTLLQDIEELSQNLDALNVDTSIVTRFVANS